MQPITALNLFPTYGSREDYTAATGKPCPPWNPKRLPKSWEDLSALSSTEDMVVYDRTFTGFVSGLPKWRRLFLTPAEAASVNIPPVGVPEVPGADKPGVPCPMRELADDEVLKPGPGPMGIGAPQVWKESELAGIEVGFCASDRALLVKIGQKLGV